MNQPLSPTAQAVIDAFSADNYGVYLEGDPDRLAAAIRTLVEAKLPEEAPYVSDLRPRDWSSLDMAMRAQRDQRQSIRAEFLAVADELEEQP